jgi:TRAP-type transport system periplasmic protein
MSNKFGIRAIRRPVLAFGVAAAAVLAWQPATTSAQVIDMKIGYPTTADPQHDAAVKFVAEIKKRTNGRIQGRVFPTSQLGRIPRQIEGIQLGTQEVFMAPPGFLVGLNQAFQVVDAPGMFASAEHAHKAITDPAFADPFLRLAENKGIVGGVVWVYDGTSYASTVPIRKLADLNGLKIRVLATPMERAVPAQFGATGVPIPFTEVVPALQRKVVDAARTSLVVMAGAKFHSVTKFLMVVNDGYIPTASWFSKVWLNRLPKDLRKILLETSRGMADWSSANALSFVKVKTQEWKDMGAEVNHFSAAEQKIYMDKVRPLGDKLLGKHKNPQVRKFYGMLKASAKRNAPM